MTWCVAKSKLAPNWMNVFAIFSIMLWFYFLLCMCISAAAVMFLAKVEGKQYKVNFPWALLVTMCFSIGIPAHYHPTVGPNRTLIACMLFFGLHFSTAYHSFLLSVLTTPRYDHQTQTIQEAIDAQFEFVGGENLKPFFDKPDPVSNYLSDAYVACLEMDKCLLELKSDSKLAVAISRQHAMNAPIPIGDNDMFCFETKQNIFSYSVVMLFKKDHHLIPLVNTLIRRIAESGFILKWKADSEGLKAKVEVTNQEAAHEHQKALNLEHLLGSYMLLAVGLSVALIAFIGEWTVYLFDQRRKAKFIKRYVDSKYLLP